MGADVSGVALGIATRENSAAVVFILDFDDDLCPGGLGAPIDCVYIRHAARLTHAQLSPWASLINRRPVIEPKASRSPVSSSARAWRHTTS
jgi:hypothetical protein